MVASIMVTPVRRSARIRRASALHPPALRDHDPLVPSLADVSEEFVFRANRALVREPPMADSDADRQI
ncbi:Hypp4842 [Branchiostoma lanceolatum]|uniref:Hypp4842 protein n=1 Tax=Branchiostoma lanceolatum TaxID=7740 RepID=A0A8K0EZL8_BRALA|nr:Hypp4842 [Branchiostoma lanceolatum]